MLRSLEALFKWPWSAATDTWLFAMLARALLTSTTQISWLFTLILPHLLSLIGLVYGGDFNLVDPLGFLYGHEEYELRDLMRQF